MSNLIGQSRVLVEINLYWKDRRTDMIESYLDDDFLNSKDIYVHNPESFDVVGKLRIGLAALFRKRGGTHLQIGRSYPFLDSRLDNTAAAIRSIKNMVDPDNRINPGALGL